MTEVWNVDCGTTVCSVHSGRVGLVSELTSRGAPTTAVARRELDHRPPHTGPYSHALSFAGNSSSPTPMLASMRRECSSYIDTTPRAARRDMTSCSSGSLPLQAMHTWPPGVSAGESADDAREHAKQRPIETRPPRITLCSPGETHFLPLAGPIVHKRLGLGKLSHLYSIIFCLSLAVFRGGGRVRRPPHQWAPAASGRACAAHDCSWPPSRDRRPSRPWRRVARADETRERRPDVGLRASLRQMVTP